MQFAPGSSSPHRWNQIRLLPLYPEIQTLADYENAVVIGLGNAAVYLREIDVLQGLRVSDFRWVHHLIFEKVHPWAGEPRGLGQMATVSGFPASDPQRIGRELAMAIMQTGELLDQAEAEEDGLKWLAALAFSHVRFERIHPFRDGNGRVGRAVLSAQYEFIFGVLPSYANQAGYRSALRASGSGDLAPLLNFLGTSSDLPEFVGAWQTPFRLAPRFLDENEDPSLLEDIAWSRLADPIT